MKRRSLIAAALAMVASGGTRANPSRIELVYIGARECPYCVLWMRRDKPALVASAMFRRLAYTEIEPRRIRDAYNPRYWPARLQPLLQALPLQDGTPRFLILRDGMLYANSLGGWPDVVPLLRRLTAGA